MRAVIPAASGEAEGEPIAELWATTTTPPVVAWAPIRAAAHHGTPPNPAAAQKPIAVCGASLQASIAVARLSAPGTSSCTRPARASGPSATPPR